MSEPEKPLHVRVAEALGWTEVKPCSDHLGIDASGYSGWPPGAIPLIGRKRPNKRIPRYDLEWDATGPLIEKYGISVDCDSSLGVGQWCAIARDESCYQGGESPLLAVCHLILALKEAGKL